MASIFDHGKLDYLRTLRACNSAVSVVESDLGQVDFAEELFHRIFGPRGITGAELDTSSDRRDLIEIQQKLAAKLRSLTGSELLAAGDLNQRILRHVSTYPTNDADATQWRITAEALKKDARKYIGMPLVAILFALTALGVGAFAVYKATR